MAHVRHLIFFLLYFVNLYSMKQKPGIHPDTLNLLSALMEQVRRAEGPWSEDECQRLSQQVAETWVTWRRLELPDSHLQGMHREVVGAHSGIPLLPQEKDQVLEQSLKLIRKAPMERGKPTPAKSLRALRLVAGFGLLAFFISLILNVYWIFQYQNSHSLSLASPSEQERRYLDLYARFEALENQTIRLLQPNNSFFNVSDPSGWELKAVWITNDSGLLIHIDSFPSENSMTLLQVPQDSLEPITIDTLNAAKAKDLVYYLPLVSKPDSLLLAPQDF